MTEVIDSKSGEERTVKDYEKAYIVAFLVERGIPNVFENRLEAVLAVLANWPIERAVAAFEEAREQGLVSMEQYIVMNEKKEEE